MFLVEKSDISKKERKKVSPRGHILFLLTPVKMVMAAAGPMRSSFRLGRRTWLCTPPSTPKPTQGGAETDWKKNRVCVSTIYLYNNVQTL